MTQVKIVVFVPKTHTDIVRQAVGDAGDGIKIHNLLNIWDEEYEKQLSKLQ